MLIKLSNKALIDPNEIYFINYDEEKKQYTIHLRNIPHSNIIASEADIFKIMQWFGVEL